MQGGKNGQCAPSDSTGLGAAGGLSFASLAAEEEEEAEEEAGAGEDGGLETDGPEKEGAGTAAAAEAAGMLFAGCCEGSFLGVGLSLGVGAAVVALLSSSSSSTLTAISLPAARSLSSRFKNMSSLSASGGANP